MRDLPRLIGVGGNINAGKDTVAMYLQAKYSYVPRGFADPLYEQLRQINPPIYCPELYKHQNYSDLVTMYGVDATKRQYPEVRRLLRVLGTECGRDIHGDDCWLNVIDGRMRYDPRTVIKDTRHINEVYFMLDRGAVLINVVSGRSVPLDPQAHSSECLNFAKYAEYTVDNSGSYEETYEQVESILDVIQQQWRSAV